MRVGLIDCVHERENMCRVGSILLIFDGLYAISLLFAGC